MKLLFDQNLSFRLVAALAAEFPESNQVRLLGLETATDEFVWEYARTHGFALVSKDEDFANLAAMKGFPPKVLWLRIGNCTWREVEGLLRQRRDAILGFDADPVLSCLELL